MTYKGKDYMITSNSFIFHMSNGSQDAVNLLATRFITRPAFLDLGGGAPGILSGSGDSKFLT